MKKNNHAAALRAKIAASSGGVHSGMLHFLGTKQERDFAKILLSGSDGKSIEYYLNLWRAAKRLDRATGTIIQHIVGTEIDLQNILWVYRLKNFYKLYGERVYSYLVPIRYRINAPVFAEMVECRDVNALLLALADTKYGRIFGDFENTEEKLRNAMAQLYKKEAKHCHLALFMEVFQ